MNLKQKIEATILLLFSFVLLGLLDIYLLPIRYIYLSDYLAFVMLALLLLVWILDYLNKKLMQIVAKTLKYLYFLLFGYTMVLFLRTVYKFFLPQILVEKYPLLIKTITILALFFFLFSYIESIYKFSKKSLSRKYFNGLYLIFSIFLWRISDYLWNTEVSGMEGAAMAEAARIILSIAFSFYLISLIIAAVEFVIKRNKSTPESNTAAYNQQTAGL